MRAVVGSEVRLYFLFNLHADIILVRLLIYLVAVGTLDISASVTYYLYIYVGYVSRLR